MFYFDNSYFPSIIQNKHDTRVPQSPVPTLQQSQTLVLTTRCRHCNFQTHWKLTWQLIADNLSPASVTKQEVSKPVWLFINHKENRDKTCSWTNWDAEDRYFYDAPDTFNPLNFAKPQIRHVDWDGENIWLQLWWWAAWGLVGIEWYSQVRNLTSLSM